MAFKYILLKAGVRFDRTLEDGLSYPMDEHIQIDLPNFSNLPGRIPVSPRGIPS